MQGRLQPDCTLCADLCCVAYAFDAGYGFGVDKRPDQRCPNLAQCKGCAIHPDLERNGFGGCVQYNCHGAGVRVTQELFNGKDWRRDPGLIGPMCAALRALAPAHEKAVMLDYATRLDVPTAVRDACADMRDLLLECDVVSAPGLCKRADALLRSLAPMVAG